MKDRATDIAKTAGAVLIIGGIVVATFLYGNRQRQEQLRKDQQTKEQQDQATQQATQQPAPVAPVTPSETPQAALPGNVGGGQVPVAGSSLPETGAGLLYAVGATATVLAYGAERRSRKALLNAQL